MGREGKLQGVVGGARSKEVTGRREVVGNNDRRSKGSGLVLLT